MRCDVIGRISERRGKVQLVEQDATNDVERRTKAQTAKHEEEGADLEEGSEVK